MSDELVITLLACLVWFSAFILLIVYVSNKIYEIREDVDNSKIENMNNVMLHMLEQCKHEPGQEFCLDMITSYNSHHDEKFRDAVQAAKHLRNCRRKSREISHDSKEISND